jgi:hypothetical protein
MVKQSWSTDKAKANKIKKEQIKTERLRQFGLLKNTPAFTAVTIVSVFNPVTREPKDTITMQNGDTYTGPRKDVEKLISLIITEKVDELLGFRVKVSFFVTLNPASA